jgi:hypothetical protein
MVDVAIVAALGDEGSTGAPLESSEPLTVGLAADLEAVGVAGPA